MDLTLQQLRMLRELAAVGTISATADSLGYTPSAVSQQLSALERAVGQPLLERVGRNVRLTDASRVLVAAGHGIALMPDPGWPAHHPVSGSSTSTRRFDAPSSSPTAERAPSERRTSAERPAVRAVRDVAVEVAAARHLRQVG